MFTMFIRLPQSTDYRFDQFKKVFFLSFLLQNFIVPIEQGAIVIAFNFQLMYQLYKKKKNADLHTHNFYYSHHFVTKKIVIFNRYEKLNHLEMIRVHILADVSNIWNTILQFQKRKINCIEQNAYF